MLSIDTTFKSFPGLEGSCLSVLLLLARPKLLPLVLLLAGSDDGVTLSEDSALVGNSGLSDIVCRKATELDCQRGIMHGTR